LPVGRRTKFGKTKAAKYGRGEAKWGRSKFLKRNACRGDQQRDSEGSMKRGEDSTMNGSDRGKVVRGLGSRPYEPEKELTIAEKG